MKIKFKRLHKDAILPTYSSVGASGFDLSSVDNIVIPVGKTVLVHTGWAVEIPFGYEMQIRPRSGLSLKTGLMIKNSPGTIDSDYRGEVGIIIYNTGEKFGHYINYGDRIAQGVIVPIQHVKIEETGDEFESTERGAGGYGSTGL